MRRHHVSVSMAAVVAAVLCASAYHSRMSSPLFNSRFGCLAPSPWPHEPSLFGHGSYVSDVDFSVCTALCWKSEHRGKSAGNLAFPRGNGTRGEGVPSLHSEKELSDCRLLGYWAHVHVLPAIGSTEANIVGCSLWVCCSLCNSAVSVLLVADLGRLQIPRLCKNKPNLFIYYCSLCAYVHGGHT